MAAPLAGAVREAARLIAGFSTSAATGGRPCASAPVPVEPRDPKTVAKVRMWDESTSWLIAHLDGFPHVTERREWIAKITPT
ncbi:hypothetical protein [Streptomyces mirabilis]|uniref:hypothetical protein n=1 Tax=Streptomyces mirabilis TaxID=68239 RepID=UPI00369DECD6